MTTFVNFSDALRDDYTAVPGAPDPLNDEFYGGVSIAYEW